MRRSRELFSEERVPQTQVRSAASCATRSTVRLSFDSLAHLHITIRHSRRVAHAVAGSVAPSGLEKALREAQ